MCMGDDHSSAEIKRQGQKSRSMLKSQGQACSRATLKLPGMTQAESRRVEG